MPRVLSRFDCRWLHLKDRSPKQTTACPEDYGHLVSHGMKDKNEPSHQFRARIQADSITVENVITKVHLPRRFTERIRLHLFPTDEQNRALSRLFEFSLFAEVQGFTKKVEIVFEAKRAYVVSSSTKMWGLDLHEFQTEAEIYDFSVRHLRPRPEVKAGSVTGCFWLTPCLLLSPSNSVERSYTGNVKVRNLRSLRFKLKTGLRLSFSFIYRYFDDENSDQISFPELVANFKDTSLIGDAEKILEHCLNELDDFLLLTSFAGRQRCFCGGWEAGDSNGFVTFYRRGLTFPKHKKNHNFNDTLIDPSQFERFLKQAYPRFIEIEPKDYIRQALNAITAEDRTIEAKFVALFSALETLVLKNRRDTNGEFVMPLHEWKGVHENIRKHLKSVPGLAEDKTKRALIYENLAGLNRIAFSKAFNELCAKLQVPLDDLWPVCGKSETVSLTQIRNKLVHGEPLDHKQLRTLATASCHLEWIVERLFLALLGWPITESRVANHFLIRMSSYSNWQGATF